MAFQYIISTESPPPLDGREACERDLASSANCPSGYLARYDLKSSGLLLFLMVSQNASSMAAGSPPYPSITANGFCCLVEPRSTAMRFGTASCTYFTSCDSVPSPLSLAAAP